MVAGSSALPTPWVAQLECVDAPYQRKKGEEGNNPQAELISENPNGPRTRGQARLPSGEVGYAEKAKIKSETSNLPFETKTKVVGPGPEGRWQNVNVMGAV